MKRGRNGDAGVPESVVAGRLRALPSVSSLLSHPDVDSLMSHMPHEQVVEAARRALEDKRTELLEGRGEAPSEQEMAALVVAHAREAIEPRLRPVINATGVIIHTNLGRAPLSRTAVRAMQQAASYSNLEFNLEEGTRGSRYDHAAHLLRRAVGCEDALVVNNNAAALVLVLSAFAAGREVVLSRGQSVEIGGGFRIPDVMKQSGARLVEVGTTNRTYTRDYAEAITPETAAIMRVHASNFRVVGFTTEPELTDLVALAHERGVLMIDDIGSGALLDTARFGLLPEPLAQSSVRAGADLVLFSGDKLLGGPQAGIIAGKSDAVQRLKKHPLARALRVDKITLAALEATLIHYIKGEALTEVPVWRMISASPDELRARAERLLAGLGAAGISADLAEGSSAIGGGSLPGETLPTWLVSIAPGGKQDRADAGRLAARLRAGTPPVVARVEEGAVLLDPRTVLPDEDSTLLECITAAYSAG